jgi:hypothetical protein
MPRGEANALLRVLTARGFVVDAAIEARVRACTDLAALERWVTRAVKRPLSDRSHSGQHLGELRHQILPSGESAFLNQEQARSHQIEIE